MCRMYFLMLFMALSVMANAVTLYVDSASGADSNNGKSPTASKATITAAITAASSGDTILVSAGQYSGDIVIDKKLSIRGTSGASNTVVTGTGSSSVIRITSSAGETTIEGLSLTGGYGYKPSSSSNNTYGGAIEVCADATIKSCILYGNGTPYFGGAMHSTDGAKVTCTNCLFYSNSCQYAGGAYLVEAGSVATLDHCTFYNNSDRNGYALCYANSGKMVVKNSIVWGSSSPVGSFLADGGSITISYSCVQGGYSGTGNISTDPKFEDAANGDFSLQATSPCINTGDPSCADSDGTRADMGYYGVTIQHMETTDSPADHNEDVDNLVPADGDYTVMKDGYTWQYRINDGRVTLLGGVTPELTGDIVIPASFGGCPLVTIGNEAFVDKFYDVNSITIPYGVEQINDKAFWNNEIDKDQSKLIIIPETVTNLTGWGIFKFTGATLKWTIGTKGVSIVNGYGHPFWYYYGTIKLDAYCDSLPENFPNTDTISYFRCLPQHADTWISAVGSDKFHGLLSNDYKYGEKSVVTFYVAHGQAMETREGVQGLKYGTLPEPTKPGDTFLGWYTEPCERLGFDDGIIVDKEDTVSGPQISLYAHWKNAGHVSPRHTAVNRLVIAPTCTSNGKADVVCEDCGEVLATNVTISARRHLKYYSQPPCTPMCDTQGATGEIKCYLCNQVFESSTTIPALGHVEGSSAITKAATATGTGTRTFYCGRCNAAIRTETIPALGAKKSDGTYSDIVGDSTWTYVISNGEATIGDGSSAAIATTTTGEITIPSVLGGCPVTAIATKAFYGCTKITGVTVQDGVASAGEYAFANCSSLTNLVFPASFNTFGNYAFYRCAKIAEVIFHGDAPSGTDVFYYSRSVCQIKVKPSSAGWGDVPGTWQYGTTSYIECNHSRTLTTGEESATCCKTGHTGRIACVDCGYIVSEGEEIPVADIHKFVETIAAIAPTCTTEGRTREVKCSECEKIFEDSVVVSALGHDPVETKAAVPPACTTIGYSREMTCSRCQEIIESVTTLDALGHNVGPWVDLGSISSTQGRRVRYCLRCWQEMEIEEYEIEPIKANGTYTETVNGITFTYVVNGGKAYLAGDYSTRAIPTDFTGEVIIPAYLGGCPVVGINAYAFREIAGITAVYMPDSVESIGAWAFWGCSGLKKVVIGKNVEYLDWGMFYQDSSLIEVILRGNAPSGDHPFYYASSECKVKVFPESTGWGTDIPGTWNQSSIEHLNCAHNSTKTIIERYSSSLNPGIKGVHCSNCWELIDETEFPNEPANGTYTEVVDGVSWTYVIQEGEAIIGTGAYGGSAVPVNQAGEIAIPEKLGGCPVVRISSYAFASRTALTCVRIPHCVKYSDSYVFNECSNLKKVICGRGLTSIAAAFYGSGNVTEVWFYGNRPSDLSSWNINYASSSVAIKVAKDSEGWGVTIPGTWNGKSISYLPDCPHSISHLKNEIEVTCTKDGYTGDQTCDECGVVLLAGSVVHCDGHQPTISIPAEVSTCMVHGHTEEHRCKNCGIVLVSAEELPLLPHTPYESKQAIAPTCTTKGKTAESSCSVCGIVLEAVRDVAMVPHTELIITPQVDPTCTEKGYDRVSECSVCGKSLSTATVIPAKGHREEITVPAVVATCTSNGRTKGSKCADCGIILAQSSESRPLGHKESSPVVTVVPTPTEKGILSYPCVRCGDIVRTEEIPYESGGDEGTYWCSATNVWVYENPLDTFRFTVLPEHRTLSESALSDGGPYTEAVDSRTDVGEIVWTFMIVDGKAVLTSGSSGVPCVDSFIVGGDIPIEVPAVLGGRPVTEIGDSAFYGCMDFGSLMIPSTVTKIGDNAFNGLSDGWGGNLIFKGNAPELSSQALEGLSCAVFLWAPCDAQGWNPNGDGMWNDCIMSYFHYTCRDVGDAGSIDWGSHSCIKCGTLQGDVEKMLFKVEHDKTITKAAVKATCVSSGCTEGWRCNHCGEEHSSEKISALGHHTLVLDAQIEPSCTSDGYAERSICSECGEILSTGSRIPKLGHQDYISKAAADATCTKDGNSEEHSCSRCNEILVPATIYPALGHVSHSLDPELPTQGAPGYINKVVCNRCNAVLREPTFTYYIAFDANGGDGVMTNLLFVTGTDLVLDKTQYARDGYTFLGWSDSLEGEVVYNDNIIISEIPSTVSGGILRLYAVWQGNAYTVKFDGNGGTGAMDDVQFSYGKSHTLPKNLFTKEGYVFDGWAENASGTPVYADDGSILKSERLDDDILTLYAKWKPVTYIIRFDSNGGERIMEDETFSFGSSKTLPKNNFYKAGNIFCGWSTEADGDVLYEDGAEVENLSRLQGDVIRLYAVWKSLVVKNVTAKQRYPWNGKVDITFEVESDAPIGLSLDGKASIVISAVDSKTGVAYFASPTCVSGDTNLVAGVHKVVWDMREDGYLYKADVNIQVSCVVPFLESAISEKNQIGAILPLYCVVDLSDGSEANSYPISYLSQIPANGWTYEYKTRKLVLRRVDTERIPYYCAIYELSQSQYEKVKGYTASGYNSRTAPAEISLNADRGDVNVYNWPIVKTVDPDTFIGRIQSRTGLQIDISTEEQWEYACRAGTTTKYSYGEEPDGAYMWYYGNNSDWSHEVGTRLPNNWGLYDMHGGAEEWCLATDVELSRGMVCRGGDVYSSALYCTSSFRNYEERKSGWGYYHGVRLVRTLSDMELAKSLGLIISESVCPNIKIDTYFEQLIDAPICYNPAWASSDSAAEVVIFDNGNEVKRATVAGEFVWQPEISGKHTLTHITYVNGVQQGEPYEISVFADWKYTVSDGKATIIATTKKSGDVVIPSVIDGYEVIALKGDIFANCQELTGVIIPNTVKSCWSSIFDGCTSLIRIDMPGHLKGRISFNNCPPNKVINYHVLVTFNDDNRILQNQSAQMEVLNGGKYGELPISSCEGYVFMGWSLNGEIINANSTVKVTTNHTLTATWGVQIGNGVWQVAVNDEDIMLNTAIVRPIGDIEIPSAINGRKIVAISSSAFSACTELSGITIPESVTNIGLKAFNDCSNMRRIMFPINALELAKLQTENNVSQNNWGTVEGESSSTSIVYQSNDINHGSATHMTMTVVGPIEFSFDWKVSSESNCDELRWYLDAVEKSAISGTGGDWQTITCSIPAGEHAIKWEYRKDGSVDKGEDCGWVRLKKEPIESMLSNIFPDSYAAITNIVITDNPTKITSHFFDGCASLESFEIPSSVTQIGNRAFANCTNLKSVFITGDINDVGQDAFLNCPNLTVIRGGSCDDLHLSHDDFCEETKIAQAATCTADGWTREVTCRRCCSVVESSNVLAKFGHVEVETKEAKVATCTEDGWTKEVSCSRCNAVLVASNVLPKLGHIEVETKAAKAATCTEDGWTKEVSCSRCKAVLVASTVLPKLGHIEVETKTAKAATCTEDGWTHEVTCSRCKSVIVASTVLQKLGHIEVETKTAKAATCTEDGWTHEVTCSRCSMVLEVSKPIAAIGHSRKTTISRIEPTCTEEGRAAEIICSRCEKIFETSQVLPSLGHSGAITKHAVASTSSSAGLTAEITCTRCAQVLQEQEEIPAFGYIRNVTARQIWPHKKVEVCYEVANDIGEVLDVDKLLTLVVKYDSSMVVAKTIIGDMTCSPGMHRVIWDAENDGVIINSSDVILQLVDGINVPGFITKTFYSSTLNFDTTSDVWSGTPAVVESPSQIYALSLNEHTTVAYGCYMWMEAGVTYYFKGCYDDYVGVRVESSWIMKNSTECKEANGSYKPTKTGFYKVEFRVGNNGGSGGLYTSSQYGIKWRTSVNTTWRNVANTSSETVFFSSLIGDGTETISVTSSGIRINTSSSVCDGMSVSGVVELGYSPFDDGETSVQVDDNLAFSSTNAGVFAWQPLTVGTHTVKHISGDYEWSRTVNVTELTGTSPSVPNPPSAEDGNITIISTSRAYAVSGGSGSIATSGSGSWNASTSVDWISLPVSTLNAGRPVAYTVSENKSAESRTGYIYVSGHVFTVTQDGVGGALDSYTANFETDGGAGDFTVLVDAQTSWKVRSNVDWISVNVEGTDAGETRTSGVGEERVIFTVAPYNEVSTRVGTITAAGKTFTVNQTGRRMKLDKDKITEDYQSHVIDVQIDALSSTQWDIELGASWLSIVDGGKGRGSDDVFIAVAENPSYVKRTGEIRIGTEYLTIIQGGRTSDALSFVISPSETTASVKGANGIISIEATSDLPWSATSQANWLTVMPSFNAGAGNGNVIYTASPNPTMSARTGRILVSPENTTGLPTLTHTVQQPAASANVSVLAHTFNPAGSSFDVEVSVDDIVNWTISNPVQWVSVNGSTSRIGPGTVTIAASENLTTISRSATLSIAGHTFAVTQPGRSVEVEYESKVFGTETDSGTLEVWPDGNVTWKAVVSEDALSWLTVWGENCSFDDDGNVVGIGEQTLEYIVSDYVGDGSPRTGTITIGDKVIYITQRAYELSISPSAVWVSGNAGSGSVSVPASVNDVWNAISTEPWITVVSGYDSGSGSGTVRYTFADNDTGTERTGKIIISGETYTITQVARQMVSVSAVATVVTGSGEPGSGNGGFVSGAGSYNRGETVTLSATVNDGYTFEGWTVDGVDAGRANPLTITADVDKEVVATFRRIPIYLVNGEAVREGTSRTFTAPEPQVDESGTVKMICLGTSAYPEKGSSFTLVVTDDIDFAWDIWQTNYLVSVKQSSGGTIKRGSSASPTTIWCPKDSMFELTAHPDSGKTFFRWNISASDHENLVPPIDTGSASLGLCVNGPFSVSAVFGVFNDTIATAIDAPAIEFKTGGDAEWKPVIDATAQTGYTSVRSGEIGTESETWLETILTGTGTLSFRWKVDCEEDDGGGVTWDRLSVFTNNVEVARIDGKSGWRGMSIPVSGEKTLVRWSFYRDDYDEPGQKPENAAWVDGIEFTAKEEK